MGLWTASSAVERTFVLPAPPARVHAVMADPQALALLHPLIDRIAVTERREVDGEHVVAFTIDEHVPLLGFSVPNHYRGENRWRDASQLDLRGFAALGIVIHQRWRLAPTAQGTAVEQRSTVTAPRCLLGFVTGTARAAHDRMIEALREHLRG